MYIKLGFDHNNFDNGQIPKKNTIKPHYRSDGPRKGSCGVFGGFYYTIETTTMEYLIIADLTLNFINQKNIWNQILVKSCIPIGEKYQHRKPYKVAEDICISPLDTKGESW